MASWFQKAQYYHAPRYCGEWWLIGKFVEICSSVDKVENASVNGLTTIK